MYVHNRRYQRERSKKPPIILAVAVVFCAVLALSTLKSTISHPVVYGVSQYENFEFTEEEVELSWPNYGQSAIGAKGYGVLEEKNTDNPQPTASVAKVMTVLAVLDKYPIHEDGEGQIIKITEKDQELFGEYWAKNGTSVNVPADSEISQYTALQYILIPSANNVADTLAMWAFGSMEEYVDYANNYARKLGLENTTIADASGFSPKTVSTASDLVKLGEIALNNPVIAEIVQQWEISLPDGSKAQNSNKFLDFEGNGVNGIKTGDTDQAGGVYLFSAEHEIGDETITIVGAIMGAESLFKAEQDAMKLLASAKTGFKKIDILQNSQTVGSFDLPWQGSVGAVTSSSVGAIAWANRMPDVNVELFELNSASGVGQEIGAINIYLGSETVTHPVHIASDTEAPSIGWKLKNPRIIN